MIRESRHPVNNDAELSAKCHELIQLIYHQMHFLPNQMPAKISCYWVLRPSQQIMSTSMMDSENRIYAIFNVLLFISLVQNWHSNLAATTLPHIADNPPDDKASLLFKDIVVLLHHNMVSGHTLLTPQCMPISQNMGCLRHSKGMQPTMPKCPPSWWQASSSKLTQ